VRITFTFVGNAGFDDPKYNTLKTHLEVSDDALYLIGCHERVLNIAKNVGELTYAALFVTCKELEIKEHQVKQATSSQWYTFTDAAILQFKNTVRRTGRNRCQVKICYPITPPEKIGIPRQRTGKKLSLTRSLIRFSPQSKDEKHKQYYNLFSQIADQSLMLLNSHPDQVWKLEGFHPMWHDTILINTFNRRSKAAEKEAKRKERESKKKAKLQKEGKPHPKTGAGRTFGAVPGIFMGVQMRSQLEIRLAAELEERGIKWIYEEERLGGGNYLVDFHLPDLSCWIEVKGKFEARDRFLLKEVAEMLGKERNEKLYAYTSRRGYHITKDEFISMKHAEFWEELTNAR